MVTQLGHGGAAARKYVGIGAGEPWCCAEVAYAEYKCDARKYFCNGRKVYYCPTAIDWCYANLADIPIYLALPGDYIFFDWEPNGLPNHIGFVLHKINDLQIMTIEGNTNGGIVAEKNRPLYVKGKKQIQAVFRPNYPVPKGAYDTSKKLEIDGECGFNTIACLQKALMIKVDGVLGKNTVKALQRAAGTTADGSWGVKTTKAVQKMVGAKVDGYCGPDTVKKLQKWINKQNETSVTGKKTWQDKTVALATKIVNDAKAGYRKFKGSDKSTWECLTCHPESDPHHKWYKRTFNCIGYIFYLLRHGGGLDINCSDHVFTDEVATKWLKMSLKDVLKEWEKLTGLKGWKAIRYKKNGIPEKKLKKCDVLIYYSNGKYYHTGMYVGDGRITDCGNWSDKAKQIAFRDYKQQDVKIAFRYIGK